MRTTVFLIIAVVLSTACSAQKSGFTNLVSKNITDGWHTYGNTTVGKAWTIDNQTIHFNPSIKEKSERGDLVTNADYENFHLKYEWKIAKNGNSGVMFNVIDDAIKYPQPYLTGPEMQVLDNNGHPDAKIFKHRAGDLYDLIPSSQETVKPAGEWNMAEIILNKGKLEFHLNGVKVVETTIWDANWDKMVANSKFKSMSDFGKHKSGKIVFQDHGDEVWYRNILIKAL